MELISRYYDNSFAGHFGINKTRELIVQKYYWSIQQADIKAYVKRYDIYLVLKTIRHKPYRDFQFFQYLYIDKKIF